MEQACANYAAIGGLADLEARVLPTDLFLGVPGFHG